MSLTHEERREKPDAARDRHRGGHVGAAVYGNPREAHEVGGVLAALRHVAYGRVLIGLFALAFIGSSVFDFVAALYRRFDPAEG